jgi:hypothetical protein
VINDTVKALAQAYIEHHSNSTHLDKDMVLTKRDNSSTEWAIDKIFDITYENPEDLWDLILEILHRDPPTEVIEVLAAGPLEDYLAKCGEKVIEKVEAQAAKDKKFKSLLGGVWQNAMSDEVWSRVKACWDRSEWDNGV